MGNNKKVKKCFANLISKKELDKMSSSEKDDFYAKQGLTKTFEIQDHPLNEICEDITVTDLGSQVLDEIINGYLSSTQYSWDTFILKNDLSIELKLAFNKKDKIKILKKFNNYHKNTLKNIELSYYYFLPDNEFKKDIEYYKTKLENPTLHNYYFLPDKQLKKISYKGFKDFFYDEMTKDKNLIENYITTDSFRYEEYQCFKDWSDIEKSYEMIKYLKKQLEALENTPNNDQKNKEIPLFYDFFNLNKITRDQIDEIQTEFKEVKPKKTAALIKNLQEKHLIPINLKRLRFVRALNQQHLLNINSINKWFELNSNFKNDDIEYNKVKSLLNDILNKKS